MSIYIIQWQTKECYIGQRWVETAQEATKIINEHFKKKHQSLQSFIISNTGEIKELSIYYKNLEEE